MSESGLVALVEDDPDARILTMRWLEHAGYEVEPLESAEALFDALQTTLPDVLCLDLELPGLSGLETLRRLRKTHPQLPIIILTAHRDVDTVVEAMQRGAYDYLPKPLDRTKLMTTIKNAIEKLQLTLRVQHLERGQTDDYSGMLGQSRAMRNLFRQIDRVAASDVTVLIHGESGTGKELVARALHEEGARKKHPFVAVNCAAIPESLQESELFGHEKGAFTGAEARRRGCFERADGGTLFLDEVAELSPTLQAKLLRVLQDRTFTRVGGETELRSDFRLVAASHRNLFGQVAEGAFREDLFFRIAVFELDVPALREREDDVILLANHFVRSGNPEAQLTDRACQLIRGYAWPGNVRELENAIKRALVVCREGQIDADDFPRRIREAAGSDIPRTGPVSMEDLERRALAEALERCDGNIGAVVKELGIGRTTVYRKLKKYGLR
ncbi:MAG: sigma-54 dependent transcriptional regulator [Myxococcota bacterium]